MSRTGPSFCAAAGDGGVLIERSGGAFLEPVHAGLTAVSCASSSACVAVAADGAVIRWDGVSWSSPVTVDGAGGGLTSVSCPASGTCVATDFAGRQLSLS